MAGNDEGNVDGDGLLFVDSEEIHVEAVVLYGMELELVKDCGASLTSVEDEVHDVGIRRAEESLEVLVADSEEDVFYAAAVEIAGNESLFAESLDDGFVADLAGLALEFKMLHNFFVLLNSWLFWGAGIPLHRDIVPKNAGANIVIISYSTSFVALFHARVL